MRSTRAFGRAGKSGAFGPMPGGPPGKPPIRAMERGPAELVGLPGPPLVAAVLVPSAWEVALVFPELSANALFVPGLSGSAIKTRILVELVAPPARVELLVPSLAARVAAIVLVDAFAEASVAFVVVSVAITGAFVGF